MVLGGNKMVGENVTAKQTGIRVRGPSNNRAALTTSGGKRPHLPERARAAPAVPSQILVLDEPQNLFSHLLPVAQHVVQRGGRRGAVVDCKARLVGVYGLHSVETAAPDAHHRQRERVLGHVLRVEEGRGVAREEVGLDPAGSQSQSP